MKAKTELPEWCLILKELEEEAKRECTAPSEAKRDFSFRGDA
jgi:hypothetical protein